MSPQPAAGVRDVRTKLVWSIALAGAAFVVLPILLYWFVIGRVPAVTSEAARTRVSEGSAVLVDIRPPDSYRDRHVAGSVNWPAAEILTLEAGQPLPPELHGKRLLLMCESGIMSTFATNRLRHLGWPDTFSVQEGISGYIVSGETPCPLELVRGMFEGSRPAPARPSPLHEQVALVFTGFGLKPLYMALSFVLVLILWRSRAGDLVALRWGMACFFAGEAACAVNYLVFNETSHLSDSDQPAAPNWTHRFKETGVPPVYELYDQIWLSPGLSGHLSAACIHRRTNKTGNGSDHDPAWVELQGL